MQFDNDLVKALPMYLPAVRMQTDQEEQCHVGKCQYLNLQSPNRLADVILRSEFAALERRWLRSRGGWSGVLHRCARVSGPGFRRGELSRRHR